MPRKFASGLLGRSSERVTSHIHGTIRRDVLDAAADAIGAVHGARQYLR